MRKRLFSQMTADEVVEMVDRMSNAAMQYADEIGVSGFSTLGTYDVYSDLGAAVTNAWLKAVQASAETKKEFSQYGH